MLLKNLSLSQEKKKNIIKPSGFTVMFVVYIFTQCILEYSWNQTKL